VWERRIAVVATFRYINAWNFEETLRVAEALLSDLHELIHKAVGWIVRGGGQAAVLDRRGLKGCVA
jgi:3-methyladenine DNA glycosylase AlkD